MHFVGMSGMSLTDGDGNSIEYQYRVDLTVGSLVIVIFCIYCSLLIVSHDRAFTTDNLDAVRKFIREAHTLSFQELRQMNSKQMFLLQSLFRNILPLVAGGVLTAGGVCVMHYIGMQAMVFPGYIQWNGGVVFCSVVIAIVAGTAAFWILFRLLALFPYMEVLRFLSAAIMAIAVNGMHYTGMAAATFVHEPDKLNYTGSSLMSLTAAVNGAVVSSVIVMLFVFVLTMSDLRMWYYNSSNALRDVDMILSELKEDPDVVSNRFVQQVLRARMGIANSAIIKSSHLAKSRDHSGNPSRLASHHGSAKISPENVPDIQQLQKNLARYESQVSQIA